MDPVPLFEPEPEPVPEQSETQRAAGDGLMPTGELAKDADGFPTGIVVRPTGGGGGSHGFRWGYWVYPLPSPGALDVFAEWSSVGISEARITLDADEIRSAAERAMVLWS